MQSQMLFYQVKILYRNGQTKICGDNYCCHLYISNQPYRNIAEPVCDGAGTTAKLFIVLRKSDRKI
jgi:hypothetical protein